MKTFRMLRNGQQVVAEGVIFPDGTTVVRWAVPGMPNSTVVWASLEDAMVVHNHDGNTTIEWAST